jgi:ABC-type polysaccharide/polyol phosphate transport system ATPase subunit
MLLIKDLTRIYGSVRAVDGASLSVAEGSCVGIIGRNGCGKSTLLQIIAGTLAPTTGSVEAQGKVAALLELGSGFNPEFTGRENAYMNGSIQGLSKEYDLKKIVRACKKVNKTTASQGSSINDVTCTVLFDQLFCAAFFVERVHKHLK